ncbi:MAG: NAD+ synthase, partial [Phycisphaerales bacterium]|nr:NAD+ synthase [Phycisphaerales bacterium]
HSSGLTIVFGVPLRHVAHEGTLTNSLVVYRDGKRIARYDKRLLPTYDVFDEDRYFRSGNTPVVIEVDGLKIGLSICEDLWKGVDVGRGDRYEGQADPVAELVNAGARMIVNPSASPFVLGKHDRHLAILSQHAERHGVPVLAVNQLGGNDDLVFDGSAWAVDKSGRLAVAGGRFSDELVIVETDGLDHAEPISDDHTHGASAMIEALTVGVRDYVRKTGFRSVCLGLSGGIDSALTAAIAARALGAENVTGIAMPGKYSSQHSIDDAKDLADRLGCRFAVVPIEKPFAGFGAALDPLFETLGHRRLGVELPDLTEENLQSRVRGTTLMALSNRSGDLLLTTGNKSELAVGYCTLYGDMNGGLGVLGDVPKTLVYEISRELNANHARYGFEREPIPERTITKPPSAELAPNQVDQDSLPPYEVLDEIVRRHVEERQSAERIVAECGFDGAVVRKMVRLIAINEYKRKQTPVTLKVTGVAFGPGRRVPIARKI